MSVFFRTSFRCLNKAVPSSSRNQISRSILRQRPILDSQKKFCSTKSQQEISKKFCSTKSQQEISREETKDYSKDGFVRCFHFPHMPKIRVLQKFKILHSLGVCGFLVPLCVNSSLQGTIDPKVAASAAGLGVVSVATFVLFGELFGQIVGSIYLHEKEDIVKISHLGFFGNRKDYLLNLEDIVLLNDSSAKTGNILWEVKLYTENIPEEDLKLKPGKFQICTGYGVIDDENVWKDIFGSLPEIYDVNRFKDMGKN